MIIQKEISKRCYIWWHTVRTFLAQNAFLLIDIISQMFISNFMCKNFFSLLDRNFFKGEVHNLYFFYNYPQMHSRVCSSHQDIVNIMDWLSVWRFLEWKLNLKESCRNEHMKTLNAYFFRKHTSTSPMQPLFKGIFSPTHNHAEVERQHPLPNCTTQSCLRFGSRR